MALDFPASPTVGQTFTGPNSVNWKWDGAKWVAGGVTAGGGTVSSISVGAGLAATPNPITGIGTVSLQVPVATTNGGTGLNTYAQGDVLYASAANVLSKLAKDVTPTRYLSNTGTNNSPAWAQIDLGTGVTGTMPVTGGGTGQTTWAQGDMLYANATNTLVKLAKNTTATRYLSNTGPNNDPAWAQINVANGVTGVLPVANGGTGSATAAGAPFVEIAGDTMTGNLQIMPASGYSALILNKPASGQGSIIYGQTANLNRWVVWLGDTAGESGSNVGSDFAVARFGDNGAYLDTPFAISRSSGTPTFISSPQVRSVWPALQLIKPASGTACMLIGYTGSTASPRWILSLGDNNPESGSNAGSDFYLARYNDAGTYINNSITIKRSTGYIQLDSPYIYLYGSGGNGAVFGTGGPLLYADPNYVMVKLGSGNTAFHVEDYSGSAIGGFTNDGWMLSWGGRKTVKNDGTYCYIANEQQTPSVFITSAVNYYRSAIHSFQDAAANTWVKIDGGGLTTFINQGAIFIGGAANFYLQNGSDQTIYANNGYTCAHIYTKSNGYYSWGVNGARSFISIYGGYLQNDAAPCAGYGAYVNNSDARMKTDIADLDRGIDTVMKLKPVEYTRIEPDRGDKDGPTPYPGPWEFRRELGFIAQDLMESLPESVVELPHGIAGIKTFEGSNMPPLGIQSEMILAVAVKAIQELQAEIETLKARLN